MPGAGNQLINQFVLSLLNLLVVVGHSSFSQFYDPHTNFLTRSSKSPDNPKLCSVHVLVRELSTSQTVRIKFATGFVACIGHHW
jgi:hypothetical protein